MVSFSRSLTAPTPLRVEPMPAVALSIALSFFAPAALAQDEGWYAELTGGIGWLSDTPYEQSEVNTGKISFDGGFGAGAALGYDFGQWRLEGEYLYQTNDTKGVSGEGAMFAGQAGDFSAVVISANAIREFDLFGSDKAVSYAGIGLAWLQEVDIDFDVAGEEVSFSDSGVGAQVFAGVAYRLNERWTAGGELRYLAAGKTKLNGEGDASGTVTADYDRTSILMSLRYRF